MVSFSRDDFDLEEPRPQLSGHEQAISRSVVGNPVQDCLGTQPIPRHQASQINPGRNLSRLRRNPRDPIRMPDVGVDLAADVLELIQVSDRGTARSVTVTRLTSRNVSGWRKRSRSLPSLRMNPEQSRVRPHPSPV